MKPRTLILLAEDDDELRELIQVWLEREGHKVVAVDDGFQLLDYLVLAGQGKGVPHPHLILSDVSMPGRSAVDALVEIRQLESQCPIVLISAFADDETRGRALREGAALFLDKPVDPRLLACAVQVLLEPMDAGHRPE